MANRTKAERNAKIIEFADKGWRHIAIARMFKMKTSTVSVVIWRARQRERNDGSYRQISKV